MIVFIKTSLFVDVTVAFPFVAFIELILTKFSASTKALLAVVITALLVSILPSDAKI